MEEVHAAFVHVSECVDTGQYFDFFPMRVPKFHKVWNCERCVHTELRSVFHPEDEMCYGFQIDACHVDAKFFKVFHCCLLFNV